jgi:fructokinase
MTVVKVSAADLGWLYPGSTSAAVAARWTRLGAGLVVVTDGGRGATAYLPDEVVTVASPTIEVADTIGAGDTFNAGLLAWMFEHDRLHPAQAAALTAAEVAEMLGFAAATAAITCSRPGADPPWRDELPARH